MILPSTLRARFAFWTAGLLLAVLAIFGCYIYESMSRNLAEELDETLSFSASQVAAALEIENGSLKLPDGFEQRRTDLLENEVSIRIQTADRTLIQVGPPYSLPPPPANQSVPSFADIKNPLNGESVRVYSLPVEDNGRHIGVIQTAESYKDVNDTLHRLLTTLFIAGPLLALLAGLGGYFLAARALAPIDEIAQTARRISAEDLSARINLPATDDEVGRLAETFDAMLGRLHQSFLHERQFTADASHELRTPLTAMLAILDAVRAKRRTPEDYELALADLAKESERLRTLTENLLRLGQSSVPKPGMYEVTDLSPLLRDVTDSFRPLAVSKGIRMSCDVPEDLMVVGDNDDLIRLFVNLSENAVKYTKSGEIEVSAKPVGDMAIVSIRDTGIGIPPDALPYVFDRFFRVDKARTEGSAGLGLAIALEIVQLHRGTIDVRSEEGKGTTFEVQLVLQKESAVL